MKNQNKHFDDKKKDIACALDHYRAKFEVMLADAGKLIY